MVTAVLSVSQPIGENFYFHLEIAKYYARGDFTGGWNYTAAFPYMPLFQLFMVPLVWSGRAYQIGLVLQAILTPIIYGLVLWLMNSKVSSKAAFITGLVLMASRAFIHGTLQVRPETLDLLVYPLIVSLMLNDKRKLTLTLALVSVYGHGIPAIGNLYGLFLKQIRKHWRTVTLASIAVLPVLIIAVNHFYGFSNTWGNLKEAYAITPQYLIFYGGLNFMGLLFLFKRRKSGLESLLSCGVVASMIMIPLWADRWMQYASIPLSCLVGSGLALYDFKKDKGLLIMLVLVYSFYIAYFLTESFTGGWVAGTL
jgi:hypothetical protein